MATRNAGRSDTCSIIVAMMHSGALAGMMALNPTMGDQHNVALDFVSGAGFVGIAVALMGRSHPVGIILAALLFGMLYQRGAELSFEMPNISRDMIVIIQGLVILFASALQYMLRPAIQTLFASFRSRSGGMTEGTGASHGCLVRRRPYSRLPHSPLRSTAARLPGASLFGARRNFRQRPG